MIIRITFFRSGELGSPRRARSKLSGLARWQDGSCSGPDKPTARLTNRVSGGRTVGKRDEKGKISGSWDELSDDA